MRITYIGPNWGTSRHRAQALQRLGHDVAVIDPWERLGHSWWIGHWLNHGGAVGVGLLVNRGITSQAMRARPQLIFVNQGEFLGPKVIGDLRSLGVPIANYTTDNPFDFRYGGQRFRLYLKALPHYDLLAVPRERNVGQALRMGARRVIRVWMSADEVAHKPREIIPQQRARFASEVAFIGTWMRERGSFIAELIRLGVPVSIWGDRWQKAPEWPVIAPHWRGPGIYDEENYAAAIISAKVCLGLLSKDAHDLHTTRSMEIPALGGLLCAERTSEHLALYEEGVEAVFWSDAAECAQVCQRSLGDASYRQSIARRGRQRLQRNGNYNERLLAGIVAEAVGTAPSTS